MSCVFCVGVISKLAGGVSRKKIRIYPSIESDRRNISKTFVTFSMFLLNDLNLYEWSRANMKKPHKIARTKVYIPK